MKTGFAFAALLSLSACVSVTVDEKMVRDEAPDCMAPMGNFVGNTQITVTPLNSLAIEGGKTITATRLDVPPGAKSNAHQHAGTVFVYVLKGAVCSQVTGDAGLKPYKAGESFFEPAGSQHLGFTNPGLVTAQVLVTFVADTGATLTRPVQ